MNINRLLLVLLVSAILSGIGGWYLSSKYLDTSMTNYKNEINQEHELVKVVVAVEDLPSGVSITSANAVLREMPKAFVHRDAITQDTFGNIVGRQLLYSLSSGDPILSAHVSLSQYRSFSDVIPKGMRAVTIPVDSLNSISGFLSPSNYVDLFVTFGAGKISRTTQLLSAAKVIATGRDIDNGIAPSGVYRDITLGVTPLNAARILHAMSIGKISLVLRTQDDTSSSAVKPVDINNIFGQKKRVKKRKITDFEVIRGGK